MRILSMLSAALGLAASNTVTPQMATNAPFRGPTPSRRVRVNSKELCDGCIQSDKDDYLPRGYPGAKLARKAHQSAIAVKHPRGLRLNGVTV